MPAAAYTAGAVTKETKSNGEDQSETTTDGEENDAVEVIETEEQEADVQQPEDPLQTAREEAAQLKDKLIRMAADFDNFRKRSRREVADAERKGRDGLLGDLLPVFDNLERATSHAQSQDQADDPASVKGLVDGIQLVMKQFRDALGRLGIERVESVGQPFDPSVHEAIQHMETSEHPPGSIAAEVQPGYRQGERLVRPALVVVAKAPQQAQPSADESGNTSDGDGPSESED